MDEKPQYNQLDLQDHIGIWLWIENRQGEIYMLYHKKFDCWTIPLEKLEPGEKLEAAIKRSGREEVGIAIEEYNIIHSQTNTYQRDGRGISVKAFLIKVIKYSGEVINAEPQKHTDQGWKSKDFILSLTDSTDAVVALQKYIS